MEKHWKHSQAERRVKELEQDVQYSKSMIEDTNKGLVQFLVFYGIIIAIIACGAAMLIYGTTGVLYGLVVSGLLIYGLYYLSLAGEYGQAMPELQKRLRQQERELEQERRLLEIWNRPN